MEEKKCKACGAPLVRDGLNWKCEYCGTIYTEKRGTPEMFVVERTPLDTHVLGAEVHVDRYTMQAMRKNGHEEKIAEYSIQQLTHRLAEGLAAYMRTEVSRDPFTQAQIVRGYVRVVDPDFRY